MSLDELPLYCADCNEVHHFKWLQVERIVYTLQGDRADLDEAEPFCLVQVLRWSLDGEMYEEHASAHVESREHFQPLDCPGHTNDTGPHHTPLCHYFDTEDERAEVTP